MNFHGMDRIRLIFVQEARQEVMNRGVELTEVQDGIREAESAAKVRLICTKFIKTGNFSSPLSVN